MSDARVLSHVAATCSVVYDLVLSAARPVLESGTLEEAAGLVGNWQ